MQAGREVTQYVDPSRTVYTQNAVPPNKKQDSRLSYDALFAKVF